MKNSNIKKMLALIVLLLLHQDLIQQVKAQNTISNSSNCQPYCLKCLNTQECVVCDQSNFYFLDAQNNCQYIENCTNTNLQNQCITCRDPYYPVNGICQLGSNISNCKEKLTDTYCQQCNQQYYQKSGLCYQVQQIIQNCLFYGQKNQCVQCSEDYVLTNENICQQKLQSCKLHQNIICKSCQEGYYLSKTMAFDYLQILQTGIYKTIYYESCLLLQIVDNCIKYNQQGQCEICAEKHYLENNKCIFLPPVKYNIIPIENCQRYLKKNQCYQCNFNFQLSNDRTKCLPIIEHQGCLGYSSLDYINQCSACSQNYYLDQNKNCQQRQNYPIINCQNYDINSDSCKECQSQYQLHQDNTQCISSNCKIIQNGTCLECEDLYYLQQDICIKGTIQNCINYQIDQNICQLCDYKNRYILEGNQCIQSQEIIPNCQIYDQNLKCQTCNPSSLPLYIQNNCETHLRRLQSVLNCQSPLISNYNDTECIDEKFQNCSNYDDVQCYLCVENYILYEGICVENFAHFTQNCEVQNQQTNYLDFVVQYLIIGDQSQYLQVHDESKYVTSDDLIALRYDEYLQSKPEWTEQNKTLLEHQIYRKNYTNLKFVKNQQSCKYCQQNSFPAFALGFCVDKKYVQKQQYYTEGCQSYYEENCIQCKNGYYLSFQYFLIDEFKINLQNNGINTEDNITFNGTKEKDNKYGYMYKTFCTQSCQNIAEKGLINTPIYSKYLQFLNSGSFFRFDSNSKFTTSRAEIVLIKNLCLDEFDKQQDLDDGIISNKWEGCQHVSSSLLAINHISKPYRSSITSNEQFSIFQQGKGLPKNSQNYCSKCSQGYVKLYDLNYKEYKNSVVIDLDTTPTTQNNPFVKYNIGHHCINEQSDQIFELLENCDMYTIESFPTFKDFSFYYDKKEDKLNDLAGKIYRKDTHQEIEEQFFYDYKHVNEMNRNFVQNSKFKTKFVCVKCKFGYRDRIEPQKNYSIPFPNQCLAQQAMTSLPQSLESFFQQEYGGTPIWIFEGYQTQEEHRQELIFFLCSMQGNFDPSCFVSQETLDGVTQLEQQILQEYYSSIDNIISQNISGNKEECSQCKGSFKVHKKVEKINLILKGKNSVEVPIELDVEYQNCYANKRYFENCQEPIPDCDLSKQLEPGVDPKSYFFSCHYCLPKNGVPQVPVMNIKGMNLVLNVSKFQEEIFTQHNYKLDPEFSKKKGYEVLNQPYLYLSPLNDVIDPNGQNPDHFISCWPLKKLQIGETKTIQNSQQDKTIYIHQGQDIADMNYRLFTFEKVSTNFQNKIATNYLKEDQGQLYKGVYCQNSSFYYTFDFESLNQIQYKDLANGDLDIGKIVFNYFMQGILENANISCTNNLTSLNIKRQCYQYKQNADGICIDSDLSFGVQVTQHYDQLRNRLRNFPLLFTDQELQQNYDKNQNNKFITYSLLTKELFQFASRNFSSSMYLMGLDSNNLETAYNQIPFILGNGQNDFFNYGIFHVKNGIQNCAVEGWLRKSIDSYQSFEQYSLEKINLQKNGQFNPFFNNDEICVDKFSILVNSQQQCYYYAQSQNYQNFYDYYDLNKNELTHIGCLRCKDGYELIDNNKSCQKIQIPNCNSTNNILKNSNSLVNYVIDNMFINTYYGIQEGIGCSECQENYISINDNELQFYQQNLNEQNSIQNKINYEKFQFTHKNQMCIILQENVNKIQNCLKYGIDFTKQFKDQIYICYECQGTFKPSFNQNSCINYPNNCIQVNEQNDQILCTKCDDQFVLNTQDNSCIQKIENCQQHKFDIQNNLICELCNNGQQNVSSCLLIEHCISFDSNNNCTQCDNQYQNFQTQCVLMPQNCQSVNIDGVCQNCISDQYQLQNNECILLPQNCLEINQNQQCQKCEISYVLQQHVDNTNKCVYVDMPQFAKSCSNYFLQNTNELTCTECVNVSNNIQPLQSELLICHIQYIENCIKYQPPLNFNGQFQCLRCKNEKILQNNNCQQDRLLIQDCLIYEVSQNECQQCKEGYRLIQYDNQTQKQCILVLDIQNCIQYTQNQQQCQQCENGYILNSSQDFCEDPNCENYLDGQCIKCNTNTHYLLNNQCYQNINNCEIHNQDQTCQKCINGYYLNSQNDTCIQHTIIQNCELYDQNENICKLCQQNYHLQENQLSCVINQQQQNYEWLQGCQLYASQDICKVCQTGYYLNTNNKCVQTSLEIQNCQNYSQDSECQQCQGEYQLYQNQCVIADSNNCVEYLSSYFDNQKCNICKDGYVLSFDGKCLKKSDYLNSNLEFQYSIYIQENINVYDYVSNLTIYEQEILNTQNCKVFNETQTCIQCNKGYYLNLQNSCIKIDQIVNCENMIEIQLDCLSCNDGYIKNTDNICIYDSESSGCLFSYEGNCQMCDVGNYDYQCNLVQ